ncbi:MAG: dienelactone hydrolase family protein [Chloroflexi bacterium]|nr:dienelactone hydrolase family protein [Chloroflexota bacterium]
MRALEFEHDLSSLIDQAQPSLLFEGGSPDELTEWQRRFRATLVQLLGIQPERAPLDLEYEDEVDCGAYVRHRVRYQTERDVWVPAYLLVPNGTATGGHRSIGVLCIHGHGDFGKDSVAGIGGTPEREREIERCRYDFGHRFAEAGYVVLAPDLRGFGERRPGYPGPRVDYCMRNYMAATLLGTTVVALHLCDLAVALDVLQSLPYVDGDRLVCAGLSLGGRMTMMISAMDERVKACIPSGCLNLYQERFQALRQCGAQLIPGLLRYGDTPEIFSLIAPRPMAIEWGLRDPLIPHDWAERGLARIRRAYQASGAPQNLIVHRFDAGHVFDGARADEVFCQGALPSTGRDGTGEGV